ncbi:hypothetical protein LguiA_018041 [Lonicera macranthoides]
MTLRLQPCTQIYITLLLTSFLKSSSTIPLNHLLQHLHEVLWCNYERYRIIRA